MHHRRNIRGALLVLALGACAKVHPIEERTPVWRDDLERMFLRCTACHEASGSGPDLSRYPSLFECRDDGARIESVILQTLDRPDHQSAVTASERARLEAWLTTSALEFSGELAHPAGWAAPGSSSFHGDVLLKERYLRVFDKNAPGACAGCHDQPESQGGAPACTGCHERAIGPSECGTCHGDHATGDPLPKPNRCSSNQVNASAALHALHVGSSTTARTTFPRVECSKCHDVPAQADRPGHLTGVRRADVSLPGYDPSTRSCMVSECHLTQRPSWTKAQNAQCDSCHAAPPSTPSHASARPCTVCHSPSYDANGALLATKHVDGAVEVGEACDSCHSQGPSPSAGWSPGAHAAHLLDGRFRDKLTCDTCHVIPDRVDAPGHIDQPRPSVSITGDPATASGALSPMWSAASGTCENAGCHGANLEGGMLETPAWTSSSSIACGGCHGLPPRTIRNGTDVHLQIGSEPCGDCHHDDQGFPVTEGQSSITARGRVVHINGCVDLWRGCNP